MGSNFIDSKYRTHTSEVGEYRTAFGLAVQNVTADDCTTYRCSATNVHGTLSATVLVSGKFISYVRM